AERLRAGGAVVLDAGHRNVGQAERDGERHAGLADVNLLDRGGEPGGVDAAALDAGVLDALLERLDDQVVGVLVPALPELRAAHAEDRDLVLDAGCHLRLRLSPVPNVMPGSTGHPPGRRPSPGSGPPGASPEGR